MQEQRKGELFVITDVAIMGIFPVVAVLSYANLASMASLAWSVLVATVLLAIVIVVRGTWRELARPGVLKCGFFSGLYIGAIFYALYYLALQYTSPGNVSLLMLFQVLTSFLLFNVYRREPFSPAYKAGAVFMIVGALLARDWHNPNVGDLIALGATVAAPIGNYYQQQGRRLCSGEALLFLRSAFAALLLFSLAALIGALAPITTVAAALPYLLFNGIAGFVIAKLCWIEGIHRMSVTKAIALTALGPLFTLFFAWVILGQVPTAWQLVSLAPFVVGVLLLTDQIKLSRLF